MTSESAIKRSLLNDIIIIIAKFSLLYYFTVKRYLI